jgi:hypothetical protein
MTRTFFPVHFFRSPVPDGVEDVAGAERPTSVLSHLVDKREDKVQRGVLKKKNAVITG